MCLKGGFSAIFGAKIGSEKSYIQSDCVSQNTAHGPHFSHLLVQYNALNISGSV